MGTGMKLIRASEQAVRHWFGQRGYPLDSQPIKFRVIDSDENRWLFIHDTSNEYDEVVAYQMNALVLSCEPYSHWLQENFDWNKKSLEKLVQQMED